MDRTRSYSLFEIGEAAVANAVDLSNKFNTHIHWNIIYHLSFIHMETLLYTL
jgi:hypothetical protein